jgi:hypothetical protein
MKRSILLASMAAFVLPSAVPAAASLLVQLDQDVVAAAGNTQTGVLRTLVFTTGQVMVGDMSGGGLELLPGFLQSARSTATGAGDPHLPGRTRLRPNAPNPFNPTTSISFEIGGRKPEPTRLEILDLSGRRVRLLLDEILLPGSYETSWDATDLRSQRVASGVYLCRLTAGRHQSTIRMTLVK